MNAPRRCAIYTRKSSDEGLEQDFNSLQAQREACEAYIRSQIAEGWQPLEVRYDDGGFSGGSMARPALRRLMSDIAAGRIDIVVVYKVDRLTRSLADFAKIVEAFDHRSVSFVSVTQAFNTTTSMGRLTLNVLLSFAQFEREVTAERIRDKIAASKAKGMWMGGMVPLGYAMSGRSLAINTEEAAVVRHIFTRYLEVPSVRALAQELADQGVRSKAWLSASGKPIGGGPISLGALRHILKNRLYRGEIVHKGRAHPGRHPPIVEEATFLAVAARLAVGATTKRERAIRAQSGPLAGLLHDDGGRPMGPSFAYGRGGKLYRYYVTVPASPQAGGKTASIMRVSAPAAEQFVADLVRRLIGDREVDVADIRQLLVRIEARARETHLLANAKALAGRTPGMDLAAMARRLGPDVAAFSEEGTPEQIRIVLPRAMRFRAGSTQIVGGAIDPRATINPGIVTALKRAHRELAELRASPLTASRDLHEAEAPATRYERQLSRLAFLAPTLQRRILSGTQPAGLTLRALLKTEMPLAWIDQLAWCDELARAGHLQRVVAVDAKIHRCSTAK